MGLSLILVQLLALNQITKAARKIEPLVLGISMNKLVFSNQNQYFGLGPTYNSDDDKKIFYSTEDIKFAEVSKAKSISCYENSDACLIGTSNAQIKLFKPSKSPNFDFEETYAHNNITGAIGIEKDCRTTTSGGRNKRKKVCYVNMDRKSIKELITIPKTGYFLAAGKVEFGIMRFNLDKNNEYSAYHNFGLDGESSISSMTIIWDTPFLVYYIPKKIYLLDMVKMEGFGYLYEFEDVDSIAYMSYNPSKAVLVVLQKNNLQVTNYAEKKILVDGTSLDKKIYYSKAESFKYSKIFVISSTKDIKFYEMETNGIFKHLEDKKYSSEEKIGDLKINQKESSIVFLSGDKIFRIYEETQNSENCHQFCSSCEEFWILSLFFLHKIG